MSLKGPYKRVGELVLRYWRTYGGWREVARSPYFLVALFATVVSVFNWTAVDWWDLPISIVPSMLGFTLGGYAMLVGFGGESFRSMISGKKVQADGTTKESPFINMNASFVHFMIVQSLALFFAILAKTIHGKNDHSWLSLFSKLLHIAPGTLGLVALPFWGIGFLLFMYAMTLMVAAVFSVFRVGTWVDKLSPPKEASSVVTTQPATIAETTHVQAAAPSPGLPPSAHVVTATIEERREVEMEAESNEEAEAESNEEESSKSHARR